MTNTAITDAKMLTRFKRLFPLILGLRHECFAGMCPATAKIWLALFAYATARGKMLPQDGVATLHADWSVGDIAAATKLAPKTVRMALIELEKNGIAVVHRAPTKIVGYDLCPPKRTATHHLQANMPAEPPQANPTPKPLIPAEPPKGKETTGAVVKDAIEGQRGRRGEGEDLASYVTAVLSRVESGLKLADIVRKVLHDGYKTQSHNLGQAVYNVLSKLSKEGEVKKDEHKKYALTTPEERDHPRQYWQAKHEEEEKARQEREEAIKASKAAEKERKTAKAERRVESLRAVGLSLNQATEILTRLFPVAGSLAGDGAVAEMSEAAEALAYRLELKYNKAFTPDGISQPCSVDEARALLSKATALMVEIERHP